MLKKRLQDNTRQDEASFLTAADPQKVKTFWSAEYHAQITFQLAMPMPTRNITRTNFPVGNAVADADTPTRFLGLWGAEWALIPAHPCQ